MADPIQISMYITSLGLSGKEAEAKRIELEKLSDAELTALISGKSNFSANSFDFSEAVFEFKPVLPDTGISIEKSTPQQNTPKKKYTALEKAELRNFASQYLLDSATNAYDAIDNYNKSIGIISIDAIVNGFKIFTGQEDRHALQERLGNELKQAEMLNRAASTPGAFEFKFERTRGVLYNPENIENLKNKSQEYLEISAYQEKYNILSDGIKEIKSIMQAEQEYAQAIKYVRGPAAASLTPPETSSHEKFGEVLLQLCNGNKELVNQYMEQITSQMGSRAEIEKNMPKILEELQTNFKAEYDKKLAGKNFEQYTKEYEAAYSKALGGKNPEFATQNFIEKAKTQSAYTEMGLIIASSLLLPGSSTVAKGTAALAKQVGTKAAGQIVKGVMTTSTASAPAGLTALNAVTSEKGFTQETKNEMFEELKTGVIYGGFGAYVSGPVGNAVENLIKNKPEVLTGIVSRVMSGGKTGETIAKASGVMAETSADVVFDQLTSDMSVLESLETNGGMNFAMMIAGGRIAKIHQNLQGIKIEQLNNGNYKIKDENGKLILNAKDGNSLATFVIGKGLENEYPKTQNNETPNTKGEALQAEKENVSSLQSSSNVPKGLNAENDALLQRARTQNPSEVVTDKVKKQWMQADIDTKAEDEHLDLFNPDQSAGLKRAASEINDAVTNLIFTGKLKEKLTQHYEEIGNVFKDIAQKRSTDFENLAQANKNNPQGFAEGIVKILSEEMDMKGYEPKIELIDMNGSADGLANWPEGTIQIDKSITNGKKLVEIISHEFVHMLQYRDILAQYGERGLREVIMNDKNISPDKKTGIIADILNSSYTQKLLDNFNELKHSEKGSLNEYLTRIYKDEFANTIDTNDMAAYTNQTTERLAYYAGSENLGNSTEGLENIVFGENAPNDNSLKALLKKKREQLQNGGTVVGDNTMDNPVTNNNNNAYEIDEFGQIHRKLPAGITEENTNKNIDTKETVTTANQKVNEEVMDEDRKLQLANIEIYKKTANPQDISLKIDGEDRIFTAFKGRKAADGNIILTDNNKLYKLSAVKPENVCKNELFAGDMYELIGVQKRERQLVQTDKGTAVLGETITKSGGFVPDKSALAKTYGMDALLGIRSNIVLKARNDNSSTPVVNITAPFSIYSTAPVELVRLFEPTSKNSQLLKTVSRQDIIDSLQKIVDMPDEKISELADARNIDDKDRMVKTLLGRKQFIAKFLDTMKQTEQEGLPISEYVKNIYDKTSVEIKYSDMKAQANTGLTDYLHETLNVSTKDMLNYQSLLKDTQIADYLKTELEQGRISFDDLNEITAAYYGNVKMMRYLQASPEIKKQNINTLLDLKRDNNISISSGKSLINTIAQNAETKEINTEVIDLIKQVSEQFDKNPDVAPAIYHIIKDGKINETALKLSTDLYKNGVEINTITGILSGATRNGTIDLDTAKADVINELIKSGKSPQDIGIYIKAMDAPSGLDASMTEYVDKFKAMGLDNQTIGSLFSYIRVHTQQGPIQKTYVLDWISKLAGEHPDSKTVISAARQLVKYKESLGQYIDKIAANNKEVNLGNLTKILESLIDPNTPFDRDGLQFAVNMLTKGVSPENLGNIIKASRWTSKDPIQKDIMAARTAKLRELAGTLLTEKGKSTSEVYALLTNLSDDFSINLVKDNIDSLSQKELNVVLAFTNMSPSVQKDREKLADFMLDLLKNKDYSLDDVAAISNKIITTQKNLNRVLVTGIDAETLDFAKKCAEAGLSGKDITNLTFSSRIWNNALELTPEQMAAETKKITDFAENLLFEKEIPPQKVVSLMESAAFKTNRTQNQLSLTYGFDDRAIKLINDLVEDKAITPESNTNIRELIKTIKLLDYDTQVVDTAKDLLKNEVTLQNGKSYKIDPNSLSAFLLNGRNFETKKFEPERFNRAIQDYILKADYGFALKDIDNILGLSQGEVAVNDLHMSTGEKVNLLNKLSYAPKEAIDYIESQLLTPDNLYFEKIDLTSVDQITQKLVSDINISSRSIQTTNVQRQQFLNNFISNRGRNSETGLNNIETKISEFDYTQYGEEGLPLKYNRSEFIANINDILKDLSPDERADVLKFHNIDLENNVFNTTPKVNDLQPIEINLTDEQISGLFKELNSILDGVNENNARLFKEENIDKIIEKCRQIAAVDDTKLADIANLGDFNLEQLKSIKDKVIKFGEAAYNTDTHNIPVPLSVRTLNTLAENYENFTPEMKAASAKIETEYNKFIYENEFLTDDKELNTILNGIMKGLPDMMLTVGKQQHKTHKYTLDVHTMEVLKKAINDEDYKSLSDKDKTILKYSILLHDFGKKYVNPDTPDSGHEIDSAEIAREILAQFKLPLQVKDRIVGMIKNHDWFAKFNKGEWDANKVSALFRSPDDYKIARIMAKADLSSINDNFHYDVLRIKDNRTPEGFKAAFDKKLANLDANYNKLYQATNLVYNTKILNKEKIPYNEKYGVRMLNLTDTSIPADKDLGEYGFNGSTKNNMRFSVHMVAEDNLYGNMESAKLGMEQTVNDNNVWSISLLKMDRTKTYMNRKYGFLTDVPASNIAIAYPNNLGSGYEKTIDKFVELLYSDTAEKNFLRNKFLQSMTQNGIQFTKEDYQTLTQMIYNKQFLSQLETQPTININGKDIPSEVISNAVFDSMDSLFTGKTHSEIVAINPKIQGLIVRMNNPENISPDFISFAKKYDLPIILIGDK